MSGYPLSNIDGAFAILRKPFDADALLALARKLTRPGEQNGHGR